MTNCYGLPRWLAMGVLTARETRVLVCWLCDFMEESEIAAMEGIPTAAVKHLVEWAIFKLKIAGFAVTRRERPTLTYVDPDELDRLPARRSDEPTAD